MSTFSEQVTRNVRVRVQSVYVAERSSPDEGHWFFAYQVNVLNEGNETVQLISRHWVITDGDGAEQEVRGAGVVGEQPVLAPGDTFEYTSACPLPTAVGSMHGSYQLVTDEGERFDAVIAPFGLGEPTAVH